MTPVYDAVKKYLTPLIYINLVGMVIAGPWLLIQGSLAAVWPGVIGLMASPIVFPIFLLPGAIMAGVMNLATRSHPRLTDFLTLTSVVYLVTLFTLYVAWSLYVVRDFLNDATLIPAALWGITAGIAPWAVHAAKDRDNVFFSTLVVWAEITAVIVVILIVQFDLGLWTRLFSFWGIMGFLVTLQAIYEMLKLKK